MDRGIWISRRQKPDIWEQGIYAGKAQPDCQTDHQHRHHPHPGPVRERSYLLLIQLISQIIKGKENDILERLKTLLIQKR